MSSFRDVIESAADAFVGAEVSKVLPHVGGLIPGFPGRLVSMALNNPEVQQAIAGFEEKAVSWTLDEAAKGVAAVQQLIATHVHGKLGQVLAAEFAKAPPDLPLSPQQAASIGMLVAAGKLDPALDAALAAAGLK